MARQKGVFVEPQLGRIIKIFCAEERYPQSDLAEELGLSYPTLNRAINGKLVDPATKAIIEKCAKLKAALHPEIVDKASDPLHDRAADYIVAQRLRDFFSLDDDKKALRIARSVLRGLRVFV